MLQQLKRWFSTPRGVVITAIVLVVIALVVFRTSCARRSALGHLRHDGR